MQRAGGSKPPGQGQVLGRRLGIARGVVVEQHERGSSRDDGLLEHLARVHEARGQAADRDDRLVPADDGARRGPAGRTSRPAARRSAAAGSARRRPESAGWSLRPRARSEPRPELERRQHAGGLGAAQAAGALEIEERARRRAACSPSASSSSARSSAEAPRAPVPSSTASSSRLESAAAPARASRSRGRSALRKVEHRSAPRGLAGRLRSLRSRLSHWSCRNIRC